ncbi:putative phosphatidylcholine--sterol O-acyltransferase [Dioscorea sansibarensis]
MSSWSFFLLLSLLQLPPLFSKQLLPLLLHPLIIIPGQGGNQLEARLNNKQYKPLKRECGAMSEDGNWFRLWMDCSILENPLTLPCFADQMRLHYDALLDDYGNTPGVETRVPFFGSTHGFLYKDPDLLNRSSYMAILVNRLKRIGYEEGENLFGAPYDFRYGLAGAGHPSKVGSEFLQSLKELIEHASKSNNNNPVILLTHSLGGLFTLQLLHRNTPSWSRTFIKHFIALSAPWGGTVLEMLIFASGDSMGNSNINPLILRKEIWSLETNLWLLPNPRTFKDKPIVVSKSYAKNFSAAEMSEFLSCLGCSHCVHPYESRIMPMIERLEPPAGVPMTVMTGYGIETAETLIYGDGGFDLQPEIVYGDGDGLVNLVSLLAPENEWNGLQELELLKVIKLPNVSHEGILKDDEALTEVLREIHQVNSFVVRNSSAA